MTLMITVLESILAHLNDRNRTEFNGFSRGPIYIRIFANT